MRADRGLDQALATMQIRHHWPGPIKRAARIPAPLLVAGILVAFGLISVAVQVHAAAA
ncbi:hypothetical protein [Streptomyces camelliae]|uniref:Uncharacterized protein n=1 Tax=Streptomyces camelliae TaxID=3004093 RepID=A0ABY7PFW7_9ACTN|nr:hypothetical protein [Streptomyces sp. HUAS 2-6]WBO69549.1 hypothetical protein O1G22_43115 [Streptomyces sp. HUAS 2-6]